MVTSVRSVANPGAETISFSCWAWRTLIVRNALAIGGLFGNQSEPGQDDDLSARNRRAGGVLDPNRQSGDPEPKASEPQAKDRQTTKHTTRIEGVTTTARRFT